MASIEAPLTICGSKILAWGTWSIVELVNPYSTLQSLRSHAAHSTFSFNPFPSDELVQLVMCQVSCTLWQHLLSWSVFTCKMAGFGNCSCAFDVWEFTSCTGCLRWCRGSVKGSSCNHAAEIVENRCTPLDQVISPIESSGHRRDTWNAGQHASDMTSAGCSVLAMLKSDCCKGNSQFLGMDLTLWRHLSVEQSYRKGLIKIDLWSAWGQMLFLNSPGFFPKIGEIYQLANPLTLVCCTRCELPSRATCWRPAFTFESRAYHVDGDPPRTLVSVSLLHPKCISPTCSVHGCTLGLVHGGHVLILNDEIWVTAYLSATRNVWSLF